jgi:hypothetical protein
LGIDSLKVSTAQAVAMYHQGTHGSQTMAEYNISVLCSDCGRFHQTKTSVAVIDGPDRVKKIDTVYRPNELPPEVPQLLGRYVMCPVTRNSLKFAENKLYLVPLD